MFEPILDVPGCEKDKVEVPYDYNSPYLSDVEYDDDEEEDDGDNDEEEEDTNEDADEETLGGAEMHAKQSGLADYLARDE